MGLSASYSPRQSYQPFSAFSLIWAVTTLIHLLAFTFWAETWEGWLLVVTTFSVIRRPSCVMRFLIMVIAALINLWHKMPFVPNHVLFEGMLHLIMLLGGVSFFWRGKGREALRGNVAGWKRYLPVMIGVALLMVVFRQFCECWHGQAVGGIVTFCLLFGVGHSLKQVEHIGEGEDLLERFAPAAKAALILMYWWAVLQKLNWDYFDPEVSCAGVLHREINVYFGSILPEAPWALTGAAVGSLVFELGIPVLLIFRRMRWMGFVAAIWFHLWLSIHPAAGIFSFSSLILAVLVLFLPRSWGNELQVIWERQLAWLGKGDVEKGRERSRRGVLTIFLVALISQGLMYLLIGRSYEVFYKANRIGFAVFFTWGLWMGTCYLLAAWRARKTDDEPMQGRRLLQRMSPVLFIIGLIPVATNGLHPWIGGRTQTSFSMYSNLRSEGEGNHIFLNRVDLLEMQNDLVQVLQSAPNVLQPSSRPQGISQFANLGHHILPWFEFRRLISQRNGDFEVTYVRGGEEMELGRRDGEIYGDASAFEPLPCWQQKLIWFRRLKSTEGPMTCTH